MANPHSHPDVEVNFLHRGTLRYFLGGGFLTIKAGEVAVFWAGMPHQTLDKSGNAEGIWLTLPLLWLLQRRHTQQMAGRLLQGQVVCYQAEPAHRLAFAQWCEDFSRTDEDLRDILRREVECHLARVSRSLAGEGGVVRERFTGGNAQIETVLLHLARHYQEDLRAADIARVVGLHPKYLLILFRRVCRMTLWEYVLRLRLAHAQRLLLTSDRTVTDIALEAGFQSLSAFYHTFRKYGPKVSPAEFRAGTEPGKEVSLPDLRNPSPRPRSGFDRKGASHDACRHARAQD